MRDRVLLLADSLAFHGPARSELLTHPGLWGSRLAAETGREVDVVARLGWTARDGWWAVTKDPYVYSVLLPRAAAVVVSLGNADMLPVSLPPYLREGLAHLRPPALRRAARRAYFAAHPHVVRATGGRRRTLPQALTDHYLSRVVGGVRHFHPEAVVVGVVPPPFDAAAHAHRSVTQPPAAAAARAWGLREGVPLVELDRVVAPHLAAGTLNPDGMHWSWEVHAEVAAETARVLRAAGLPSPGPALAGPAR